MNPTPDPDPLVATTDSVLVAGLHDWCSGKGLLHAARRTLDGTVWRNGRRNDGPDWHGDDAEVAEKQRTAVPLALRALTGLLTDGLVRVGTPRDTFYPWRESGPDLISRVEETLTTTRFPLSSATLFHLENTLAANRRAWAIVRAEADRPPYAGRYLQHNTDRRLIYALVRTPGGTRVAGPLTPEEMDPLRPDDLAAAGSPELAEQLLASGDYHDLEDMYRWYGFGPEIADWAQGRSPAGRPLAEVASTFGIDPARLADAAEPETYEYGVADYWGGPRYNTRLFWNWAVGGPTYYRIDPCNYRFMAWLAFATGEGHHRPGVSWGS